METPVVYAFQFRFLEYEGLWEAIRSSSVLRRRILGKAWQALRPADLVKMVRNGSIPGNITIPHDALNDWLHSAARKVYGSDIFRIVMILGLKHWAMPREVFMYEIERRLQCIDDRVVFAFTEHDPIGQEVAKIFKNHWSALLKMDLSGMPFVVAAALAAVTGVNSERPYEIFELDFTILHYTKVLFEVLIPEALRWLELESSAAHGFWGKLLFQKLFTSQRQASAGTKSKKGSVS